MQKIGVATFVALLTTFSNVYSESAKAAEITEKNALVMEKSAHNWAGSYAGVNGGYAHFQDRVVS